MLAKLLFCSLLVLSIAGIGACKAAPSPERLKRHVVTLSDPDTGNTICTGVAVAKHVVWTAEHCVDGFKMPGFNGNYCPENRVIARDGTDNVFVWTCAEHKYPAKIAKGSPKVGSRIYQLGHVMGLPLMYREGYLSGIMIDPYTSHTVYVWDVQMAGGDSGSAVFDKRGRVVCTTSFGVMTSRWPHFALMACFPHKFTDEQLGYLTQ